MYIYVIVLFLTQCGISGGTPSSVTGSDRDCVPHALLEAADVQRQGERISWIRPWTKYILSFIRYKHQVLGDRWPRCGVRKLCKSCNCDCIVHIVSRSTIFTVRIMVIFSIIVIANSRAGP